jgi:hypothetical protein
MRLLLFMKAFDEFGHAVGSRFPHGPLFGYPLFGFRQPVPYQFAGARASDFPRPDEAAALEHGHGLLAAAERADDCATGRIGECVEHFAYAGLMVSHEAEYRSKAERVRLRWEEGRFPTVDVVESMAAAAEWPCVACWKSGFRVMRGVGGRGLSV